MAEITNEKEIVVAGGLGNATPDKVLAGTTYSSESGFNLQGEFIPSAANISYDNTKSGLAAKNTQAAIDEVIEELTITATATGERITVDNSADASVREFKVDGRTEQATTTGKNLLNPLTQEVTVNGITFTTNEDGSISFSGTATAKAERRITNGISLSSGNYVMSIQNYDSTVYSVEFKITRSNGAAQWLGCADKENVFSMNEGDTFNYSSITVKSGATVNATIYPMIRKAEITDGTYEPYTNGASPNPDYPQDIKGVGDSGEVEVTVTGKNLFDKTKIANGYYVTSDGVVNAGSSWAISDYVPVKANTSYTLSGGTNLGVNTSVCCYDEDKNYIGGVKYNQRDTITITTSSDVKYIRCSCETTTLDTFQLEENTVATEYESYKSQTVKIPVTSPLYEGDSSTLKNGKKEEYRENRRVVFDGSDDEQWEYFYFTGINQFFLPCNEAKFVSDTNEIHVYSEQFRGIAQNDRVNNYETIYTMTSGGNNRICINTQCAYSVEEWKTYLAENPITVVYQLAEPIIETIETDIDLSTYNHVTNITNSDNANMEVEYFVNNRHADMVTELTKEIKRLDDEKADNTEIKRLDNEKADIEKLKDYMIVQIYHDDVGDIAADESFQKSFLVNGLDGYKPMFVNVENRNHMPVVCVSNSIDPTGEDFYVSYTMYNFSQQTLNVKTIIKVLCVREI